MNLENPQEKEFEKISRWQKSVSLKNEHKRKEAKHAGQLVSQILRDLELKSKRHNSLMEIWEEILPDEFKGSCRAEGMQGSILKVKVVLPAWMYQLSLHSEEFINKLNERRAGSKVRKIKFEL